MEVFAGIIFMIIMILSMLLPFLMFGFMIFAIGFWIWMIVDCSTNPTLNDSDKLIWVLIIVLTNWIGAIIYFFVGRPKVSVANAPNSTPPSILVPPQLPPPVPTPIKTENENKNMKIVNLGSINIDHVYNVEHFVRPGETISGLDYNIFAGGKGFNQSIALARAGATTIHAGKVGENSEWLLRQLEQDGTDISHISTVATATGHAVIQVAPSGENAIVLYGGANQCITSNDVTLAIDTCAPGDYFLTQNETSEVASAMQEAHKMKLQIVFNPAPMNATIHDYPLELVDIFILNETEAEGLTGKIAPEDIRVSMLEKYPESATVLTLGSKGAIYFDKDSMHHETAASVNAIDTTAAGDTFIGFFLAELMQSNNPAKALKQGCHAAAICVTKPGASNSIPTSNEIAIDLHAV